VEYRFAGGRPGELPRLARELVDAKVDVIMAAGDEPIVAAKERYAHRFRSYMVACDAGHHRLRREPRSSQAGNLTGPWTCITSELMPKRMACVPRASAVCVPASWLFTTQRTSVSPPRRAARLVEAREKSWVLDAKAVSVPHGRRHRARLFRLCDRSPRWPRRPDRTALDCPREALGRAFAQRERLASHAFVQRKGSHAGGLISYGPQTIGRWW